MLKTFIRIVMAAGVLTVMGIGSPWAADQTSPPAGGQKVTLVLGGKFCDSYPEDVEMALKKVSGVKAVDLKSMPGHAVVEVESGKAKPDQLVAAVNGVKGSGWQCTAQLKK
jgi:mercuric ion binding protein